MLRNKKYFAYLFNLLILTVLLVAPKTLFSQGLGDVSIVITFDSVPEIYEAEIARLKYNKTFALSMQIDDGDASIIDIGLPVFMGGEVNGTIYNGLTYTDGCGNFLNFSMSSAIYMFSGNNLTGEDLHNDPASDIVTWQELNTLYNNNWGIENHGINNSSSTDIDSMNFSVARNTSYTRRKMFNTIPGGVITKVFVNPYGINAYSDPAFNHGQIGALNQNWQTSPLGNYGGDVNSVNWNTEHYDLYRLIAEDIDVTELVDSLYNQSKNGANFWSPIFTHSIPKNYPLNEFIDDFEYIYSKYGSDGSDEILMTTDEEILDYLIIRDGTSLNSTLDGKELTITFSGNIPTNLLFYDLSVVVNADAKIKDVTVFGTLDHESAETGDTTMLVNFAWDGKIIPSPESLATDYVEIAKTTQTEYDALIAMDYVYTVDYGAFKAGLVDELCAITGVQYDEGFCESGYPRFVKITGDSILTVGSSGTLTATDGLKSYWWNTGENTRSIEVSPAEDTKYWVQSVTQYNDTVSDTIMVVVNDTYFVDHSPEFVHHIVGIPETLWVTMAAGATPRWNDGSTEESLIVDPEETEIFTCSAIVDEQVVQTIEFEVFVGNIIQFNYDSVCLGDSSTMTNTSIISDTIVNILWDLDGDSKFDDGEGEQVRYLYESPGNHLVGMRIIFKNDPMDVVYNPVPVGDNPAPDFSYQDICLGSATSFFDESEVSYGIIDKWFWDFGDEQQSTFENTTNVYNEAGEYEVMLKVWSDYGCFDSIFKSIEIVDIPGIALQTGDGTIINDGDTAFFNEGSTVTFTITNFTEYDSVVWSNDEKGQNFTVADSGSYSVDAYSSECSTFLRFHASWGSSPGPGPTPGNDIMNLFTPNGDGYNDFWLVNDPNMVYPIGVKVYTRAGKIVYENNNYDNTWTGLYNGNPLPQGAYYYIIDDANGNNFKGAVTIIR